MSTYYDHEWFNLWTRAIFAFFYSSEKSYPTTITNLKPQSFIQNDFEQDYMVKDYWLYLISK